LIIKYMVKYGFFKIITSNTLSKSAIAYAVLAY
jgi:hypothetical protein